MAALLMALPAGAGSPQASNGNGNGNAASNADNGPANPGRSNDGGNPGTSNPAPESRGSASSAEHSNSRASRDAAVTTTETPAQALVVAGNTSTTTSGGAGSKATAGTNNTTSNKYGGQVCDGDPRTPKDTTNDYENNCQGRDSDNGNGGGGAGGRPCEGCVGNADDKNPPGQARNGSDSNSGYECDGRKRGALPGNQGNGNHGVGDGNPAHTGCSKPPTENCPAGSTKPECNPPCPPGSKDAKCNPPCPPGSKDAKCSNTCPPNSNSPQCTNNPPCVGSAANNFCGNPPCVATAANNFCGTSNPNCVGTAANNFCRPTTEVQGVVLDRPTPPGATVIESTPAGEAGRPTQVAGVQLNRGPLAFTGGELLPLAATGFGSIASGLGALAFRRRRDSSIDIAERLEGHVL